MPPVEFWLGTSPGQAPNCRAMANWLKRVTLATSAEVGSGYCLARVPRSGFVTAARHGWRVKALRYLRRTIERDPAPVETVDERRQRHPGLRGASPDVRVDRDPVRVVESAA